MDDPQSRVQLLHDIDARQDSLLDQLEQLNHRLESLIKAALSEKVEDCPAVNEIAVA